MSDIRKSTRFYIDRDAGTPVVRSVPVARAVDRDAARPALETLQRRDNDLAMLHAASESRRRGARHRLTTLVRGSVRRHEVDS